MFRYQFLVCQVVSDFTVETCGKPKDFPHIDLLPQIFLTRVVNTQKYQTICKSMSL